MEFGEALRMLLGGERVRRRKWIGQWVVLQRGYPDGIAINEQTATAIGQPPGAVRRFRRYLMARYPDGTFGPWDVGQEDVLGDDWEAVAGD